MAELVRVLWAYSTHRSWRDQEEGFWDTIHHRAVSISWFFLSVWPLAWGWYLDDKLTWAPNNWQNSLQKINVNWGPRSVRGKLGESDEVCHLAEPVYHRQDGGVVV